MKGNFVRSSPLALLAPLVLLSDWVFTDDKVVFAR